jgi:SAM-dependent methyltransferase
MLFHITDKPGLFVEIQRVLKPGGRFYASTVGENHMVEIAQMIIKFDSRLADWGNVTDAFTLENGAAQLSPWFNEIALHRYQDALLVTEVEPLLDYILSGWISLEADDMIRFTAFVENEMEAGGGVIRITKDSGIFESICI